MKKYLSYLRILFFCFFLFFPCTIRALEGTSEVIYIEDKTAQFDIGKIRFFNIGYTTYSNYNNTKNEAYQFHCVLQNMYGQSVELKTMVKFFDKDKNLLETAEETFVATFDENYLYEETIEMANNHSYSISDVKYYTIYAEVLSEIVSEEEETEYLKNRNYYIESYNSKIVVHKNNVIDYTEIFDVKYNKEKNYFYRKIPVNIHVDSYVDSIAKISNVESTYNFVKTLEDGYQVIKIGESNRFMDEREEIKLSFTYNLGDDYFTDKDILYINIFDDSFDVGRNNLNFEISLPSQINKEEIKFVKNGKDITESLEFDVNDNVITGSIKELEYDEALALVIDLPDGFFEDTISNIDASLKVMIVGPTFIMLIGVIICFGLARRNKCSVKKNVKIDLAELNSLELGYSRNDKLRNKDIVSLIFSLANRGYLKVKKIENEEFVLINKKKYDGDSELERLFLEYLFNGKKGFTEEELYLSDNKCFEEVKKYLKSGSKNKIYDTYINKYAFMLIFSIISILIITIVPLKVYDETNVIWGSILSVITYVIILVIVLSNYTTLEKILGILCLALFGGAIMYFLVLPALLEHYVYLCFYIIGIISIFIIILVYKNISKRTFYGDNLKRKSDVLEQLIIAKTAEELDDEFDLKCAYYDLLPFCLVFGIIDELNEKYIKRKIKCPAWFIGEELDFTEFCQYIKQIYPRITYSLETKNKRGNS